jgi:NAD(P)-dependent dehydrogenase (short-subunit alcohol dehydrogenase family)
MKGLKDKRVLITGGAGGIGAAAAKRFIGEGARVMVLDRDSAACETIRKELPELNGVITADVTDAEQVEVAFTQLDDLWNGLDVLINNAGISIRHPFLDIKTEEWRQVINTNLDGVFYVAQGAARRMKAAGSGVIINMASTNGLLGYPYYADYNASKAGVSKIPLRRHAQPEEVAALCAFLASEDAAYITGHCYVIDGGETAGGLASR